MVKCWDCSRLCVLDPVSTSEFRYRIIFHVFTFFLWQFFTFSGVGGSLNSMSAFTLIFVAGTNCNFFPKHARPSGQLNKRHFVDSV